MPYKIRVAAVVVAGGMSLIVSSASAAGQKAAAKRDPAAAAVDAVLSDESAGQVDRRERLAEAIARQPNSAVARWQAGFVLDGVVWRSFDESRPAQADDVILERYRGRRERAAKTFEDQLQLADWCQKQGLRDQERSHLTAALVLAPTDRQAVILPRLGYCMLGNQWVSGEQFAEWREMNRRTSASLKSWQTKLERIAEKLAGSRRQHEQGVANLKELASSDSIPAMEYILCGRDEVCALAAVEAFETVKSYQGTLALARQAVFSKWPAVNERATALLKMHRLDDFVPGLISLLASPVTARYSASQLFYFQDRPGDSSPCGFVLVWNYVLARETDDQFQVAVLNSADYRLNYFMRGAVLNSLDLIGLETGLWYDNKGMLTGVPRNPLTFPADRYHAVSVLQDGLDLETANRSDATTAYEREKQVEAMNERTDKLNKSVISVLAGVTGRDPSSDAAEWWQWWADQSDVERIGDKPVVTVVDDSEYLGNPTLRFNRISGRCCCLAAGTPVWTDRGLVAIETISVGDRVLAQDIESGGLAYKPVLQTTVRPPTPLTTLRCGDDTIICTRAHRFWNSGAGWTKAVELESQSLLHTVTGNTLVASSRTGSSAATYNLVVADFHTYFVGKTGVLSQDVLLPKGTDKVVPGLARVVTQKQE